MVYTSGQISPRQPPWALSFTAPPCQPQRLSHAGIKPVASWSATDQVTAKRTSPTGRLASSLMIAAAVVTSEGMEPSGKRSASVSCPGIKGCASLASETPDTARQSRLITSSRSSRAEPMMTIICSRSARVATTRRHQPRRYEQGRVGGLKSLWPKKSRTGRLVKFFYAGVSGGRGVPLGAYVCTQLERILC